jgi:hypothetical protein
MEPGKWALEEALAAIESETRHLVHAEARSTPTAETDVDIAPLVHKVGATSIAEIEKLIGELQEARDFLQSEGERVRRETERYTNLTQTASASVKIISDTVAGWRGAPVTWRIPQPGRCRSIRSGRTRTGICARWNTNIMYQWIKKVPIATMPSELRAKSVRWKNRAASLVTFPTSGFAAPMQAHACSLAAISWERSRGPARC